MFIVLCAVVSIGTTLLAPSEAHATGQNCGVFSPCSHSHDYCRFISITRSVCTERGDGGESCTGLGQGTCKSGLRCDILGECRHVPGQTGELCGLGVPCASNLVCSADIAGRCQARGGSGDSCSGIGQGSCQSGLVCDLNRTCRHDPPIINEPCGTGVPCATSDLYCSSPIGGTCLARGNGGESCTGLGQGTCLNGLLCDFLGECRHVPGELGEFCGTGVPCIASLGCSADVGGRCEARGSSGDTCSGVGQGSCESGLVCDLNRTCRHDPPIINEPCGTGVPCATSNLYCSSPIGGTCLARGDGGESCTGLGQGTCLDGLLCDFLGECRHVPGELGEFCGTGVPCIASLGCSADIGGRCEERGESGDSCSGIGQGSCVDGLLCDFNRTCRHEVPELGEPCGLGVPCISSLGCSADVGGLCEERDVSGETCSGIGQGSCADGLLCDALRECRHSPPQLDERCGIGVPCADDTLFCQIGTGRCKRRKTVGEGCSIANQCLKDLSCEICLTDGCDYPLMCFPNSANGILTEQQCNAIYIGFLHDRARDLGVAMTYAVGDSAAAGVAESQGIGVAYGPDDRYGCYTSLCVGAAVDVEIAAFVSVGFYNDLDSVGGSSTAFVEEVETPGGTFNFSTSQVFGRTPDDLLGPLIGTEDCFSIGISPDLLPFSFGVYGCETVLDIVRDGTTPLESPYCGDSVVDPGEGCDDGNVFIGDGCSPFCTNEVICGDGDLDLGEGCDDGNRTDGDGCSASCIPEPRCGDGDITLGEQCDDGGTISGDSCSASCQLEASCGNHRPDTGEQCDDGDLDENDGCDSNCRLTLCGDSVLTLNEECDDGNLIDGDGCETDCTLTPLLQSKAQRKCLTQLNLSLAKVAKAQGTEVQKCLSDWSRDKLDGLTPDACILADRKGKIAKATDKTTEAANKHCGTSPDFGAADAGAVNAAGLAQLDLALKIFGPDLGNTIARKSVDPTRAKCQQALTKSVLLCQAAWFAEFNRCQKKGTLKGDVAGALDLDNCLSANLLASKSIAPKCDKLEGKKLDKIRKDIVKHCGPVDLARAFPGCATDSAEPLHTCLSTSAACNACNALKLANGLDVDCDLFDDGSVNGSCIE